MASLEERLTKIRDEEHKILIAIDERNKKMTIECGSCNNPHEIGVLKAIQTHWYTEPHGCTGGDYWKQGELQFVCPKTGIVNRLLFDNNDVPWEERRVYENDPEQQFKAIYKKLFKEVVDAYGDKTGDKWVNNHYVDKHRRMFGLVEKRREQCKPH